VPRIIVYGPQITPYTEKVVRALRFKGLPHQLVEPTSPEDFQRWSPETGLLPVIDVDGTRVHDSIAILDLLEARFPEPPLVSADPRTAREQRRLEQWVGETFVYHLLRWVRARVGRAPADPAPGAPQGLLARLGLIGPDGKLAPEFYDTRDGGPGPGFEHSLDELVRLLGAKPFFFGDRLSRADLAVFAFTLGLQLDRYAGGRRLLDERPSLGAHVERVERETGGEAQRA
jgi:glutathione S-transferase